MKNTAYVSSQTVAVLPVIARIAIAITFVLLSVRTTVATVDSSSPLQQSQPQHRKPFLKRRLTSYRRYLAYQNSNINQGDPNPNPNQPKTTSHSHSEQQHHQQQQKAHSWKPFNSMRAWTCHGRNQRDMVDRLRQAGIIQSDAVAAVMNLVDRQYYVPRQASSQTSSNFNPIASLLTSSSSNSIPQPYQDSPIPIGLGQTISAPHMHAHALEEILPYVLKKERSDDDESNNDHEEEQSLKFLDVGCGSGYLTACFGRWVKSAPSQPSSDPSTTAATTSTTETTRTSSSNINDSILGRRGHVYGIDIHEHLVEFTRSNLLSGTDADLLDATSLPSVTEPAPAATTGMDGSGSGLADTTTDTEIDTPVVSLHTANGWEGLPQFAPFDVIHVGASAATLPLQLARQLRVGGVMIIPIGPQHGTQALYKIERFDTKSSGGSSSSANVQDPDGVTSTETGPSTASATTTTPTPSTRTTTSTSSSTTTVLLDDSDATATEFRITQLLGVRYVPLIEQPPPRPPPPTTTTTTTTTPSLSVPMP